MGFPTFEVSPTSAHDLCDIERVLCTVDVETGHIFACLRRDDPQSFVKNLRSGATQILASTMCRHSAELLRTDRHQDILLLQSFDERVAPLGPAAVPATRYAKEASADENWLEIRPVLQLLKQMTGPVPFQITIPPR